MKNSICIYYFLHLFYLNKSMLEPYHNQIKIDKDILQTSGHVPHHEGSEAEIYLVRKQGNEYVAIKVLLLQPEDGFPSLNEIDILSRFNHPYLLKTQELLSFDQYTGQDKIGLVLPLGKWTLRNAIESKLLDEKQIVNIMWKLAVALAFLHQHNVLHLDLKPENIILRGVKDQLRPLIADFRFSRYGRKIKCKDLYISTNYRPPEIIIAAGMGEEFIYTTKSDVWSLGIIYLEMLIGLKNILPNLDLLFHPESRLVFLHKLISKEYKDSIDLLFRMLDPNPKSRLDSFDILNSCFFTTRIDQPLPEGKILRCPLDIQDISLASEYLEDIADLIINKIDNFSSAAWLGGINLYSRLEYYLQHKLIKLISIQDYPIHCIFWVVLFITYKLYDNPIDSNLTFFQTQSQLPIDTFLKLEKEIIFLFNGRLATYEGEYQGLKEYILL